MIDPARRLRRRLKRVNQRGGAEKGQEIASLHRGILLLDTLSMRAPICTGYHGVTPRKRRQSQGCRRFYQARR
jgi:hypothetical protein